MNGYNDFEEEEDDGGGCVVVCEVKKPEDLLAGFLKMKKVFGYCGAMLIDHISRGCKGEPSFADGHVWFVRSLDDLAEDIDYCRRTVSRILKLLVNAEVLIVGCYNEGRWDRTKWYRVNEAAVNEALAHGSYLPTAEASASEPDPPFVPLLRPFTLRRRIPNPPDSPERPSA